MSTTLFARQARRPKPTAPTTEIEIQEPPAVPEDAGSGISSLLMYLPMGLGSMAMVMMFVRPGSGVLAYVGGGMMLLSVVGMLIAQLMRSSVTHKQKLNGDRRDYIRYLAQLRNQVRTSLGEQQRAARWIHPDPHGLWSIALGYRLWERRPAHDDFGEVRLGLGTQRSTLKMQPPNTKPIEDLEPLSAHALRRFLRAYSTLSDAPIAVYLRGFGQIQFSGDDQAVLGLVRAMLAQFATAHAPGDVRIAVCATDERIDRWDWLKWLPHNQDLESRDAAGARRLVTDSIAEIELLLGGPAFTGRPRFEADTPITASEPFVVLVLDGIVLPADHRAADEGYRNAVVLDVSGSLPWQQRAGALFLDVGTDQAHTVSFDRLGKPRNTPLCRPDSLSEVAATALARTMARFRVGEVTEDDEPMAADYDLAGLLGLGDVATFEPTKYRRERMTSKRRLRVPIGIAGGGAPLELDIKEAAEDGMGPHGLCIGATGSGKSELLRTLVLALATTHSSEDLNFVLVDFKGGAAFLGFDQLPHTSAVITNLAEELELVDRMQDALTGELNRRQEHLRAAGNYASRRDYEAARAQGVQLEPMPALFIVVDEFSEMLSSKPEFIDVFAMIGRLGRSLGVHMLLASQRLDEGRIHKVETHLSYRIGLRTFSAMESRSVIGVPDAYELPNSPGNGYLRPDTQTLIRFKGAFSSAPYLAKRRRTGIDSVEQHVTPFGTRYVEPPSVLEPEPEPEPDDSQESTDTMLDVLLERLRDVGPRAHQVWLPPLKKPATLDQLLPPLVDHVELGPRPVGDLQTANLTVPVGLIDLPAQQRRELLTADLSGAKGNVAVVGGPQSGKSTMLRTLIAGLALTHTAAEVQFYCLDFGGTLTALAKLPHVGSIANRLDRDRVTRTVLEVTNLMTRREGIFAEHNIDSMASYRRARQQGKYTDIDPHGDVFLVVDGWYTVRQDFEDVEERFTELAARGLSFGIHLVIATNRWSEMRPWLRDVIGTRFELKLGDPVDSEINSRFAATVPAIPGRGITVDKLHFLAALPRIDGYSGTDDLADATVELAEALALPTAPVAPKVRLLPHTLSVTELPGPTAPSPTAEMRMALGIEDVELGPQWHDFDASPHLLIYGDAETGKTNLLRHIARSVVAHHSSDEARVMFGDFRRELTDSIPPEYQLEYAVGAEALTKSIAGAAPVFEKRIPGPEISPSRLHKRDWWKGGRLYIIIDDFELAESSGSSGPLGPLLPVIPQAADVGVHIIVARSTAGASRSMMNPAIRRMWELGTPALLLSCPKTEGAFLGNVKPRVLPAGRGQFINRRRSVRLVQTPLVEGPAKAHQD
ncbi:type VII secretion protein EccCa [Amycolatopsis sp. EV170708-02-1]|uniref:type VII secretion protein EccCa n=1 Tax=Amycolatopsis sp. EV170708-02-1 TaxID=2919322 RepID=UPI001F0CAA1D|nr:type VII secretion protein EccCa [Amycolatopsis sp. EV170708-02-1]UMP06951.1 type VII secretion protein EccCa [Amycolatopsis sp. EV170708-02-1]